MAGKVAVLRRNLQRKVRQLRSVGRWGGGGETRVMRGVCPTQTSVTRVARPIGGKCFRGPGSGSDNGGELADCGNYSYDPTALSMLKNLSIAISICTT